MIEDPPGAEDDFEPSEPVVELPSWIPILLGVVLVTMAAFAVYTGMTHRGKPLARAVRHPVSTARRVVANVLPGDTDDPAPNPATSVTTSKMAIAGDGKSISSATILRAGRGMMIKAEPNTASVFVNERLIGTAAQFSRLDSIYEFPAEGSFSVRLMADGFEDAVYLVTVEPEADQEIAEIEVRLRRAKGPRG